MASNELINKVCLVSCIVFKLKGMTINFPALKACSVIVLKYNLYKLDLCALLSRLAVSINKNLFSRPIFITAPTSRKFTLEKQILFLL